MSNSIAPTVVAKFEWQDGGGLFAHRGSLLTRAEPNHVPNLSTPGGALEDLLLHLQPDDMKHVALPSRLIDPHAASKVSKNVAHINLQWFSATGAIEHEVAISAPLKGMYGHVKELVEAARLVVARR